MPNQSYTIQPGDTFWSIAQKLGVDLKALQDANAGVDANDLQPNTAINVPNNQQN